MNAGKLRHRVTIQSPPDPADPENQSPEGEPTRPWNDLADRWASIEPKGGGESFSAGQVVPTATHLVTIRHLSSVTQACRVKFGSRYLYVQSMIDLEERGIWLELTCEERPDVEGD
jgi:SPP1 family predicted phage head-tail adaptor